MSCEALCTPQLHGIVAVRPSRLRLQYCLEAANLRPVSASVEAKSTQAPTSFRHELKIYCMSDFPPKYQRRGLYKEILLILSRG
jgi:hypothetical protein